MEGVAVFTLGLDRFHVVSARDEAGAFSLEGVALHRQQTTRDRVRAAIANAGLSVPRNRKITITPPLPRGALSPDLAIALAALLPHRDSFLVAIGTLSLDGSVLGGRILLIPQAGPPGLAPDCARPEPSAFQVPDLGTALTLARGPAT